jgi:hypothetical protein
VQSNAEVLQRALADPSLLEEFARKKQIVLSGSTPEDLEAARGALMQLHALLQDQDDLLKAVGFMKKRHGGGEFEGKVWWTLQEESEDAPRGSPVCGLRLSISSAGPMRCCLVVAENLGDLPIREVSMKAVLPFSVHHSCSYVSCVSAFLFLLRLRELWF